MTVATYILTYRDGGLPQRRANLDAVLAWLARFTHISVIVVEQDVAPTLPAPLPYPRCHGVFAYNPGPFNKSWGYNVGARLAQSAMLGFGDADVIVGAALWDAFQLLEHHMLAVKPYRRLLDLSEEESRPVLAGDFERIPQRDAASPPNREAIGERIVFAGGSFVIRLEAFNAPGGWDERFVGWGGEDDAFSYRIERARLRCTELDEAPAMHLWHPRPREITFDQPNYAANARLVADYARYADAQLQRLVEVQLQLNGNIDKYRPERTRIRRPMF